MVSCLFCGSSGLGWLDNVTCGIFMHRFSYVQHLKYSNSATELPSDSVAQLARAWQANCQVVGLSLSLSHRYFFPSFFLVLISHLSLSCDFDQAKV